MGGGSTTSRRKFLGTAVGATGVALAAAALQPAQAVAATPEAGSAARSPISTRGYTAGSFALELDGSSTGFLRSVDGGGAVGEVITETGGSGRFTHKHIGNLKYEDFTMQIGLGMSKAVYDWIAASWTSSYIRKNGAVVAADFKMDVKSRRNFFNALVTETTIPACDSSSKDAGYLTLGFAPETTRDVKASGTLSVGRQSQKLWLPSNFRLEIDGLDCSRVNKVDAFTIKQGIVAGEIGDSRDYEKEPGRLEFPNLRITFAEVSAPSWVAWHEDFLIQGNSGAEKEKNGRLVFLSSTLKEELLEIKFFNLGIFKLDSEAGEANSDTVARMTAELYCERMELKYGGGVIA
jgi:hypothetical protein